MKQSRIVITGLGLTAPNGNTLAEFRQNLLTGVSGVELIEVRYMGAQPAGVCHFDPLKHQKKKDIRIGTRAGSISIYCAREALADSGVNWEAADKARVGIYLGITEHGNVETEHEIYNISLFKHDTQVLVAPSQPAHRRQQPGGRGLAQPRHHRSRLHARGGLRRRQPRPDPRRADAAARRGRPGVRRRREREHPDLRHLRRLQEPGRARLASGSDQGQPPVRQARNGIVVSEGGCIYTLERLEDALARGAKIYGEIAGYCVNSDATDYVLPNAVRQAECIRQAIAHAGLHAGRHRHRQHPRHRHARRATSRNARPSARCSPAAPTCCINNTKSFIGHAMGAAGALELAGNLPSFNDLIVHPTINVDELDPQCDVPGLVLNQPRTAKRVDAILNNSFGMLGINSTLIIKRHRA